LNESIVLQTKFKNPKRAIEISRWHKSQFTREESPDFREQAKDKPKFLEILTIIVVSNLSVVCIRAINKSKYMI